jgi:hypothetical protein
MMEQDCHRGEIKNHRSDTAAGSLQSAFLSTNWNNSPARYPRETHDRLLKGGGPSEGLVQGS